MLSARIGLFGKVFLIDEYPQLYTANACIVSL